MGIGLPTPLALAGKETERGEREPRGPVARRCLAGIAL